MTRRTATALVLVVPLLLVWGSVLSRAALDTGLSPLVGGLAEMIGGLALLLAVVARQTRSPELVGILGPVDPQSRPEPAGPELVGILGPGDPQSRPEPAGPELVGILGPGDPQSRPEPAWAVGWSGVLLPGVSFFAGLVFLRDTSVGVSATALGVQPLAVYLLLAILGRTLPRRPHPALIVSSAATSTAVGASLLASGDEAVRVGGLVAGGLQVLANAGFLVADEGARSPIGGARLARRQLTWAFGFGTVVVLGAAALGAIPANEVTGAGLAWSLSAGALSAGLPILLLARLARLVPSSLLGAALGLVPAAALLAGWVLFDESVPWPSLALAALAAAVLVAVGAATPSNRVRNSDA